MLARCPHAVASPMLAARALRTSGIIASPRWRRGKTSGSAGDAGPSMHAGIQRKPPVYSAQLEFLGEHAPIPAYRVLDADGSIVDGALDPQVCLAWAVC